MSGALILSSDDAALAAWRWGGAGPTCPQCESRRVSYISTRSRYKCLVCYTQFSATTGTPFHASKLSAEQILQISRLLSSGASATDIARQMGLDYGAAWRRVFQHQRGLARVPPQGQRGRER